ncbi:ABC transporter ATP-binding protein, partial [Streptomyces sp. SID7982]|nr:ABC transporter ATP-binding protein [Streptomyces sp. SID7982]
VAELATSVTVLAAGKVLVDGPTQEVLAHPEVREAYHGTALPTGPDGSRAEAVPTVCPSPTDARG